MEMEGSINSLMATELRLGLPGTDVGAIERPKRSNKRALATDDDDSVESGDGEVVPPAAKAQVVGWPPVRSYRKNGLHGAKIMQANAAGNYVKVSMDGAPYLRKIDLNMYKGYKELREALEDMFKCFSILGEISNSAVAAEGCNGSEYAITYEDKDGDWMLVGDVPWGMFTSSCKRLRIMSGSEARGLQ